MSRTRLAVVFGGRSTEHSISCVSAGSILAAVLERVEAEVRQPGRVGVVEHAEEAAVVARFVHGRAGSVSGAEG